MRTGTVTMSNDQRSRLNVTGLVLVTLLGALGVGAGVILCEYRYITPLGALVWLLICVAFVVVGLPGQALPGPRNTSVHGAARPADEAEARAAARGASKAADLHEQTFSD